VATALAVAASAAATTPSAELILVVHRVRAVVLTTWLIVAHVLRLSGEVHHCPLVTLMSSLRHDLVIRTSPRILVSADAESMSELTVARAITTGV
jgi:hypothetical protein